MKPTEPTVAPDLLEQATLDLLARVPARWATLDRDTLTAAEARALEALVKRGLVEVRASGRVVLAEGGQSYRIQFEFSGAGGQRQVLFQICQELTNRGQEGRAFSVCALMVQPHVVEQVLADPAAVGRGLVARFSFSAQFLGCAFRCSIGSGFCRGDVGERTGLDGIDDAGGNPAALAVKDRALHGLGELRLGAL